MEILKEVIVRYVTNGRIVKAYDLYEIVRCGDCTKKDSCPLYKEHRENRGFCAWAEKKE